MIEPSLHPEGWILAVRAQPGARKNAVSGEHAGALKVCVTAPPEDGRANKALIELLSKTFAVKKSQIQLISGEKSRDKRFLFRGCSREQLAKVLSAHVESA